jgi:hypothetical protein
VGFGISLDEIATSHLATLSLDGAEPVLTGGANGLNGRGFGADAMPSIFEGERLTALDGSGAQGARLEATIALPSQRRNGRGGVGRPWSN